VRLSERTALELGAEAFNIFNRPQVGAPGSIISSTSSFGKITSPINAPPVGAGTPRQIQFLARFAF
jgi:hypothetical protein